MGRGLYVSCPPHRLFCILLIVKREKEEDVEIVSNFVVVFGILVCNVEVEFALSGLLDQDKGSCMRPKL